MSETAWHESHHGLHRLERRTRAGGRQRRREQERAFEKQGSSRTALTGEKCGIYVVDEMVATVKNLGSKGVKWG